MMGRAKRRKAKMKLIRCKKHIDSAIRRALDTKFDTITISPERVKELFGPDAFFDDKTATIVYWANVPAYIKLDKP
jgi:hypothetical protein